MYKYIEEQTSLPPFLVYNLVDPILFYFCQIGGKKNRGIKGGWLAAQKQSFSNLKCVKITQGSCENADSDSVGL